MSSFFFRLLLLLLVVVLLFVLSEELLRMAGVADETAAKSELREPEFIWPLLLLGEGWCCWWEEDMGGVEETIRSLEEERWRNDYLIDR